MKRAWLWRLRTWVPVLALLLKTSLSTSSSLPCSLDLSSILSEMATEVPSPLGLLSINLWKRKLRTHKRIPSIAQDVSVSAQGEFYDIGELSVSVAPRMGSMHRRAFQNVLSRWVIWIWSPLSFRVWDLGLPLPSSHFLIQATPLALSPPNPWRAAQTSRSQLLFWQIAFIPHLQVFFFLYCLELWAKTGHRCLKKQK